MYIKSAVFLCNKMIACVKQTLYNEIHQINRFLKLLLHIIFPFCFNDRYRSATKETHGSLSLFLRKDQVLFVNSKMPDILRKNEARRHRKNPQRARVSIVFRGFLTQPRPVYPK
ncbi:hypothetical protein HMPREF1141_1977 [Clostridium sp. MSTE9]|nr:hypothetical protein HMPREF1141_1977 [Clostridium sp. MSTE9]